MTANVALEVCGMQWGRAVSAQTWSWSRWWSIH